MKFILHLVAALLADIEGTTLNCNTVCVFDIHTLDYYLQPRTEITLECTNKLQNLLASIFTHDWSFRHIKFSKMCTESFTYRQVLHFYMYELDQMVLFITSLDLKLYFNGYNRMANYCILICRPLYMTTSLVSVFKNI